MKYTETRDKIKSGDLISFSNRAPFWRSFYDFKIYLVRLAQRSEFSHVGIAWVAAGRVFVIESVTPIPRLIMLSNDLPVYHTSVDVKWTPSVERYALSFVGNQEYQYSQWEGFKALLGLSNPNDKLIECAELVQMIYSYAGIQLDCRATPSEVTRAIQARGGVMSYLEAI